ncbi:MAG: hypothetical protein CSB46_03275, partial [Micrococcales bacterium]
MQMGDPAVAPPVGERCLVRVLGPVACAAAAQVRISQSQVQLLALLTAVGRDGASSTRLYEQLYSGHVMRSGEQTAVMRVHRLRAKLYEAAGVQVITKGPTYRLTEDCLVDWWQLEEAVRLNDIRAMLLAGSGWQDPFGGLTEDAPEISLARERARRCQRQALCLLAPKAPLNELEPVLAELQQRLRDAAFDEQLAAAAATAAYRLGRQPEALAMIARCRRELRDAYGLDGGRTLGAVEQTILNHDFDRDPVPVPRTAGHRRASSVPANERFVGRRVPLEQLENAILRGGGGNGAAMMVTGPAGAGKTALVRELAHRLSERLDVRLGGSKEADSSPMTPGHGPWLDALPDLADALARLQRSESVDEVRMRFWDMVYERLEQLGRGGGAVLILEDLHAADTQSLALLLHLVQTGVPPGVGIVTTTRPAAAVETVKSLMDPCLSLSPLTLNDVSELVALEHPDEGVLACDRFARRVHELSQGNALVATVLSRDARPGLDPASLSYAGTPSGGIGNHLDQLVTDPTLAQILGVASLIGFDFESDMLAEVLMLDHADVVDRLTAANELHLCHQTGENSWQFDHLLIAEHFGTRIGVLRPLLCSRLATHPRAPARGVLRYIHGAGEQLDRDFIVGALTKAAYELRRQLLFEEATAVLELLLTHVQGLERNDVLIRLATTTCRSGQPDQARRYRGQAFAQAQQHDDHDRMLETVVAGLPSGEYVAGEGDRLDMLGQVDPARVDPARRWEIEYWRLRLARLCNRSDIARQVIAQSAQTPADRTAPLLHLERLAFAAGSRRATRIRADLENLAERMEPGPDRVQVMVRLLLAAMAEQQEDAGGDLFDRVDAEVRRWGSARTRWLLEVIAATMARVGQRASASTHDS